MRGAAVKTPRVLFLYLSPKAYILDSYVDVLKALQARGAEIHVWCRHAQVLAVFQDKVSSGEGPPFRLYRLPRIYEFILRRSQSERVTVQLLVWLICLIFKPFNNCDAIVCDNDFEAISFSAGKETPLYTLQNTLDIFDVEYYVSQKILTRPETSFLAKADEILDRVLKGRFLPVWNGQRLQYPRDRVYTDALFGLRPYPLAKKGLGTAKRLFLAGPRYKENYTALGAPAERLMITGLVTHDGLLEKRRAWSDDQKYALMSQLGLPGDRPLICFPGSFKKPGTPRDGTAYLRETAELVRAYLDYFPAHTLIFKPHPYYAPLGESFQTDIRDYLLEEPRFHVLEQALSEDETLSLILCSDYVIAPGTLGLNAALLGKPVATYGKNDPQWLEIAKIFKHAFLMEQVDLKAEIGQFEAWSVRNAQKNTEMERYFDLTGNAADTIASTIMQDIRT